jgi:E3 ubiquitin-protein ligase UBR7
VGVGIIVYWVPCNLFQNKSAVNELNTYNHNFRGVYCTCGRPYPDPEDVIADEMIQCVLCEDWYHGRVSLNMKTSAVSSNIILKVITEHEYLFQWSVIKVVGRAMGFHGIIIATLSVILLIKKNFPS